MNRTTLLPALACGLLLGAQSAAAVTVDAGDYTRLPDGTNLALLYLQHSSSDSFYAGGDKVSGNADLDVNLSILRGVHYMDIGGTTISPQFLLPIGEVNTGGDLAGLDSSNGIGDLIFAPTIHLMQDPERKKAFALTPWLYLPTGHYDRDNAINALGENRWKLALQLGYITPLSDQWTLDLVGDVMLFGANDDYSPAGVTLKQDPLYEAQAHLRYHLSPATYLSGMVSHSWGGATEIDGVDQHNRQQRTKALLSVGHFITPQWQVLASYGRDLQVDEGGLEQNRFNLRFLKLF